MTAALQEMVSVAVQNVQDMEDMIKDPIKNLTNGSSENNGNDPYKHFVRYGFFPFTITTTTMVLVVFTA